MRQGYVSIPDGWRRQDGRGLGPFVTREVFRRPDGGRVVWESRWHRKHPGGSPATSVWWAPGAIAWWIGVLFAVGSTCFALGAFPSYATGVGTNADNLTYFIGSIFFTTAAFLQYHEAATAQTALVGPPRSGGVRSLFSVQHHRIDWWASLIQLVGTLWFNRTTLSALVVGLGATTDHHPVWRPDALGFGLLPRGELAGLGGGVQRCVRLAARQVVVVDHAAEPGRVGRLRRLGRRLLREAER